MNKTRPPIPHGPPLPSPADEGLSASYFLPVQPSVVSFAAVTRVVTRHATLLPTNLVGRSVA